MLITIIYILQWGIRQCTENKIIYKKKIHIYLYIQFLVECTEYQFPGMQLLLQPHVATLENHSNLTEVTNKQKCH